MVSSFTPRQAFQIGYGFLADVLWSSPFLFVFLHTSTASVSPRDGRCAAERQCRQSGCFALCAFALALGGVQPVGLEAIGGVPLHDYLGISIPCGHLHDFHSKTGVLMTAALMGLFVVHAEGWRRSRLIAAPIALVVALRFGRRFQHSRRLAEIATDIHAVDGDKASSEANPLDSESASTSGAKLSNSLRKPPLLVTALAAPNRCSVSRGH